MKRMVLIVCTLLAVAAAVTVSVAAEEPAIVVGRIFHIEGEFLRFVPEEQDWVDLVKDAPFGVEDTLYAGIPGMAELIIPNGSWIRIGNNTQIRFIALEANQTAVDVASGIARFYSKDSRTVIKVTSPYGYVLADPGAVFDYQVGSNSIEVIGIKGNVSFVQSATGARYTVTAGSPSILVYDQQIYSGPGNVNPEWNRWNILRDDFWASKNSVPGHSVEYLPPNLHDEAYALDENGRWESVYYEGSQRRFWRPTSVTIGWSPFTAGRWTDWDGDQTWIPAEPFGYITHHYGNWVYAGNYWYWAPPVVSVRIGLPLLNIGFFWNPGRVSWVHSGIYVGWVPLAPYETYYSRRHWGGPHTVVVKDVTAPHISPKVRDHAYANHAVVVKQHDFWGVNDYRKARVPGINRTTIVKNYREAPVVNDTVIKSYGMDKQRHRYTNITASEKPRDSKLGPVRQGGTNLPGYRKEMPPAPRQQIKGIPEVKVKREAPVEKPKGTRESGPAGNVYVPKTEKYQGRNDSTSRTTGTAGSRPGVAGKPETKPVRSESIGSGRQFPAKQGPQVPSGQQGQSAERTTRVTPAKTDRHENRGQTTLPTTTMPERKTTIRPAQQEQPAQQGSSTGRTERATPARIKPQVNPVQTGQTGTASERTRTVKPAQQEQPGPQTQPAQQRERVKPPKQDHHENISQPGQQTEQSDLTKPAGRDQQEKRR